MVRNSEPQNSLSLLKKDGLDSHYFEKISELFKIIILINFKH